MNNRVLLGGVIGGIVFFFLGYLLYGMVFRATLEANTLTGVGRTDEELQMIYLIIGNLAFGFLLAYVLHKANTTNFVSGATVAGIVGFLFGLAGNFTMYGTTNYFTGMTGVFVDMLVITIMCSVVGGVIGWWYGRSTRTATVTA